MHELSNHRRDIKSTIKGPANVASVLSLLWDKSADRLTEGELAGVACASFEVSENLRHIAQLMTEVGCLDAAVQSEPGTKAAAVERVSDILFPLVDHIQSLSELASIAHEATYMLLNPSASQHE